MGGGPPRHSPLRDLERGIVAAGCSVRSGRLNALGGGRHGPLRARPHCRLSWRPPDGRNPSCRPAQRLLPLRIAVVPAHAPPRRPCAPACSLGRRTARVWARELGSSRQQQHRCRPRRQPAPVSAPAWRCAACARLQAPARLPQPPEPPAFHMPRCSRRLARGGHDLPQVSTSAAAWPPPCRRPVLLALLCAPTGNNCAARPT